MIANTAFTIESNLFGVGLAPAANQETDLPSSIQSRQVQLGNAPHRKGHGRAIVHAAREVSYCRLEFGTASSTSVTCRHRRATACATYSVLYRGA